MAYGDIHNHNGTICRARKNPCPFGEHGHSSSYEEYVYQSADEIGIDPSVIQGVITEGVKPLDAVALAREGKLEDIAAPSDKRARRGGFVERDSKFRFRKEMTPTDLRQITREFDSQLRTRLETNRYLAPIHMKLSDRHGGGIGVPSVSYDPITEKYSTGKHRSWAYEPEFESKSLRAVVDRAAELYGYEDDEYEIVDAW